MNNVCFMRNAHIGYRFAPFWLKTFHEVKVTCDFVDRFTLLIGPSTSLELPVEHSYRDLRA
jgi:hypothetical protein